MMKLIKFTMQNSYAREHGNYLRMFCVYLVMLLIFSTNKSLLEKVVLFNVELNNELNIYADFFDWQYSRIYSSIRPRRSTSSPTRAPKKPEKIETMIKSFFICLNQKNAHYLRNIILFPNHSIICSGISTV